MQPCENSFGCSSVNIRNLRLAASNEENTKIEEDAEVEKQEPSRLARIKTRLFPPKPDDGLTFKQRLAKAGLSVVLSYGWVSNVSYSISVSLAWFIFSKQSGLSPLAPGQWKGFLAVYAGFYVFNNVIRPIRFGLSVGASLYFDKLVKQIQEKFKVKKGVAIFLVSIYFFFCVTILFSSNSSKTFFIIDRLPC
jgi:hypothetical protein